VGSYSGALATRAYQSVQGYLALQLLERPTLLGNNDRELISQLQGAVQDLTVARDLGRPPTRRGLDYRPLFARGVTLGTPVGTVTDSVYTGDEVQGLGGEQGLRISWSGTVTYPVTFRGRAYTITYGLKTAYVFAPLPQEPNGLALQQTVHGTVTIDGVVPSCLAKGVLYPGAGPGRCPV